MTLSNEDKLQYILDILNIKQSEIAKKFAITRATVNKWSIKVNRGYLYALDRVFDVPIEIFDDESLNSKERIEDFLKNTPLSKKEKSSNHKNILNSIVGEWYIYSYYNNDKLPNVLEEKIIIKNDFTVELYCCNDKLKYYGYIEISDFETIISLITKSNHNRCMIFENAVLDNSIFPSLLISKSPIIQMNIAQCSIVSKTKLSCEKAKYILGKREDT